MDVVGLARGDVSSVLEPNAGLAGLMSGHAGCRPAFVARRHCDATTVRTGRLRAEMATWSCGTGTSLTRRPRPAYAGRPMTASRTRPTPARLTGPRPTLARPAATHAATKRTIAKRTGTAPDRYDADAEFKRGVPKPPGYLPDDTGRLSPRSGAVPSSELHHAERTPAEIPRRDIDRGDTPRAHVDRPAINDPFDNRPPDRYGDPLTRPDGTRIPCFSGPPRREQAAQGWAGDCGLIAALGSVAAHRPGDITGRVRPEQDGTYTVSLSEARRTDCGAAPTGRSIDLTITREMPVYDEDPATPACAMTEDGTAWCPVVEKAFAGVDQTLGYRTTSGLARRLGFAVRSRPGRQREESPFRTCS